MTRFFEKVLVTKGTFTKPNLFNLLLTRWNNKKSSLEKKVNYINCLRHYMLGLLHRLSTPDIEWEKKHRETER